jgi:Undecaprenyl-phosphate glucose phosphotransferase
MQVVALLADVVVVLGSVLAAAAIYQRLLPSRFDDILISMGIVGAMLFVGFMALRGGYRIAHLSEVRNQVVRVIQAWLFVFFALAWIAFLFKINDVFARGTVTLWFALGGVTLIALHGLGALTLARTFARGAVSHSRVAVVAIAEETGAERIVERLTRRGVEIASFSLIPPKAGTAEGLPLRELGVAADVRRALASHHLDGIFVFSSWSERRQIEELKAELSPMPVPIHLFADHEMERMLRRPQIWVGDLIGLELERAPLGYVDRMLKRSLDLAVASVGLALLSPLMVLTAVAIVAESGLPIVFRQHRKGFGARPFAIFKFRSMTVRENGPAVVQARRGDARITRIGRMIRRTSIDELPQLFNVLRGDMSIVGPRPHALAHDDYYDGLIASYALRQHVKPGITGWAQVNGLRGETSAVEQMRARVEHDLWYIDNWSIWLDLRIIVMTALKIFVDDNAY